jgi:hypothetical protein
MIDRITQSPSLHHRLRRMMLLIALPVALHLICVRPVEPVFGGDSNRHVMTSIFFRDFITDGEFADPKGYAEHYFEQYPALGLLVWPPLFHGVCGVLMLIFGTSAEVARWLVLLSFVVSCLCVYRLARRVLDDDRASAVMILYSIAPLIFDFSRDVMLEIPALALVLVSVDQFDLWLKGTSQRNLYMASISAALAALTRFDAAVLLPFYLALFVLHGGWSKLLTRHALIASAIALCLNAPVYLLIAREMGHLHLRQAVESVGGSSDGTRNAFLAVKNLWYYPAAIVEQAGWPMAILCIAGFLTSLQSEHRRRRSVFLALLIATYLTFSPLAELRARHAIYWMPCIAFFAVCGLESLMGALRRIPRTQVFGIHPQRLIALAYSLLFASTAASSMNLPTYRIEGYRTAAEYVLHHTAAGDRVFFDGWWDGNFTYHMRHLDPTRSRTVLRGDRLLYDFVCVPATDFQRYVENDRDIVAKLLEADPKFIVLENPQFYQTIPVAQQLRDLLKAQPEIFELQEVIAVKSSIVHLPRFHLDVLQFNSKAAKEWLERR